MDCFGVWPKHNSLFFPFYRRRIIMCKKLIYLVSVFLVLGLVGPVAAQDMEIGLAAQPPCA
jgi:hypothetical protein